MTLVIGGPRLGKTSLLRQVALQVSPLAHYVDASTLLSGPEAMERALDDLDLRAAATPGRFYLLVDNADLLRGHRGDPVLVTLRNLAVEGARGRKLSVALAGGRPLRERSDDRGFPVKRVPGGLRHFPLALWDTKHVGGLLGNLSPEPNPKQVERLLSLAGHHPFLLKGLVSRWPDIDAALVACSDTFESAFREIRMQLDVPVVDGADTLDGKPLLRYLVGAGRAVPHDEAKRHMQRPRLKEEADLLCYLGILDRRIRGASGQAMLQASCGLFNGWYKRDSSSGSDTGSFRRPLATAGNG